MRARLVVIVLLVITSCTGQPSADAPATTTAPQSTQTSLDPTTTSLDQPSEEPEDPVYTDPAAPSSARAADLVSLMTLREKLGQMTLIENGSIEPAGVALYGLGGVLSGGGGVPAENSHQGWADMVDGYQGAALSTRLGIPMIYGVDAVHGHGNLEGATLFPHNIGLGAANDPDLVNRIGRATALEMTASGIRWNFAPVLAVSGDLRWGRTYETYGSDPGVVARLGTAYIEGLQGQDLSDPESVLATAKHFIGDGSTEWGTSTTSDYMIDQGVTPADETFLHEVLVPPYQAAVDAGVGSVMTSFSSWGETKMHGSDLNTTLLKEELGFDGFIVSDWGGIDQVDPRYEMAVTTAVNAGIDMAMVPFDPVLYMSALGEAVESGAVSMERIDDAVTRILTAKFEMGLFEEPIANRTLISAVGSDEHRALAREAVAKSAVLLENDGVFPISEAVDTILVLGEAADDPGIQAGGWTITWQGRPGELVGATSILEAIEARVPVGTRVLYSRTGRLRGDLENVEADLCLAAVGELPYAEGVGDDAVLEPAGLGLLGAVSDHCGQTAMILVTGRPVIITENLDDWDALVAAWWFGSEAAGLADVMFGDAPFTAKLPVAWPRAAADLPEPADPLFPYGFGLEG
jgi:beta-glucosidase